MYFILNRKTSIHTYFLDLSTESLETMTNLIIMSTHNAQSVASKYQVSVNKPILLKEMAESKSETGKIQDKLEQCTKRETRDL